MTESLSYILYGLVVGIIIAIPIGPAALLMIQRTLSKGKGPGLVSGLGTATSDTLYSVLALLSLSFIQGFIEGHKSLLLVIGGLIVCYLGFAIFRTNPIRLLKRNKESHRYWQDWFTGFLMSITNPGTLVIILSVFAAVGIHNLEIENAEDVLLTLCGVFGGETLWWFFLSRLISRFRQNFRLRTLATINMASGAFIMVLGLGSLMSGLWHILSPLIK